MLELLKKVFVIVLNEVVADVLVVILAVVFVDVVVIAVVFVIVVEVVVVDIAMVVSIIIVQGVLVVVVVVVIVAVVGVIVFVTTFVIKLVSLIATDVKMLLQDKSLFLIVLSKLSVDTSPAETMSNKNETTIVNCTYTGSVIIFCRLFKLMELSPVISERIDWTLKFHEIN